jgi:UDP-N-acetylmuramoyl-tripeptide--D-alanyl-D-alanine ligase
MVHEDSLRGLQELAAVWVGRFPSLLRIGVTGSNGKTTTKEIIAAILGELAPTVKNVGNLNSEIGLPLAVFGIDRHHRYGVFEMGVNHPGEMEQMVRVLSPDYGLITNVGTAHIGLLGSREGIALEKGRLFASLPGDGIGFYPEGFEWKEYYESLCKAPMVSFGLKTTGGIESVEDLGMEGWKISYEGLPLRLRLPGFHNLMNLMAAIRLARSLGAEAEQVRKGVESLGPVEGRSQLIHGPVQILHDSYNANRESMEALFDTLRDRVPGERLVLVLASMKELGEHTEDSHRKVGTALAALGARGVFLFGDEMESALRAAEETGFSGELRHTSEYTELEALVRGFVKPGDMVVLKGSHSMGLERLIPVLRDL